ncbi:M48 family metalloprotease [Vibrio rarus]|uniref:M48 family metalloprotease n=1 Tax=Vibrio rarus TaxID=413403 RepID=UPI0021C34FC6|nr:M48 family metalloprotease [Vibrio rarus]
MKFIANKNATRSLIVLSIVLSISGCSVSTDYDKKVGAESATAVELQMGVYDTHSLEAYVQQIGARLVSHIDNPQFEFQFKILDDPNPNAFALPGGYIFISRGLLGLVNNEDELACVMAHEIIHVTERHSVKQMRSNVLPSIVEIPGNIVGGVINEDLGNLINAPITTGNSLLMAGYSRSHESDADRLGIQLAAKAGYDPLAMNTILSRLNAAVELKTEHKTKRSYFDSHPYTADRVADVTEESKDLTVANIAPIHKDFVSQVEGLLIGENPGKGLFKDHTFLQPEMKFVIEFPDKWKKVNYSTVVATIDSSEDAAVVLTLATNEFSAQQHAQRFKNDLKRRYSVDLNVDEDALDWGQSIYSVTLTNKDKKGTSYMTRGWVNLGIDTYQIVTISTEEKKTLVDASAHSFRPMTDDELASFTQLQLAVVETKQNETLAELAQEHHNQGSLEFLALMNALDETQKLSQDKKVKVIIEVPFQQ